MKKKISIIIPTYNEEQNVLELYNRLKKVLNRLAHSHEILFIDNDSTDTTVSKLRTIQKKDKSVILILLARNFGSSQPSYLAGIHQCTGNCAVLIDSDLQDPPEVIPQFIAKWQAGYDVVYGVRVKRKGSIARRIGYFFFYRLFRSLSYIHIPLDAGDFSLIDRKVINEMRKVSENDYFIRGVRSFVGFRQTGVDYIRQDRSFGKSSINLLDNFWWAKKAIVNFSYKPLELISLVALFIAFGSFVAIIIYLYLTFFTPTAPRGIPTIIIFILFLGSIQLLSISIIAEYIAKIFDEVKRRPNFIIKKIYK